MSDAEEGSASSSDSSTVPPWRAQGSGPPPEVISSSATESEDNGDPDQPIPEWKKKFKAMTKERGEQPISPPTHPPPKEGSEEKEVPEWMKKFQTMKQKNPGLDESVSDWSVQSEHQRPTTTAPKQEESSLDDSNLPEWKKKLMQFKKRDHPIEPSKPKSTEKEEDQPEWMKKFKAMHLDESERETPVSENQSKQQSPAPVPVPVPAPPASADDENIPEWKRKLQEMEKRKSITEGSNLPSESQMEEIESPNLPPESQTEEMEGEDTGAYQEAEAPFPESEEAPVTSIRATQPDQISTQVPTQPVTTEESLSSNEVRADDIYGSLEKTDDQLKEEAKRESIYAERTEQLPTEEFIEEEIVYESEYEEEVVELPEEEEYEEIVEIEEPSVPQGFTNGAPAPDIQRPIPQPLHADGSQFHPSSTSAFESSLYASQRPPPPPGAPPLRHFPPPPDPPLHEERSQQAKEERMAAEPTLRKESLDAEPEDLDGSVVSITDEEMDILNEIWENEMQKEAEREEKLGEGEWQDPLHKPLLLTEEDHIGYEQKGGDEENPQIFEDEYVYPEEYKRQCWESPVVMCCVCLIFLILLGFAILLLLWLLVDDITLWEDDKPTGPPTPPFVGDLPTTPMDPYFPGQCQTPGQIQPNVLTQCECDGRISSIQPDVRAKYEALRDTFIPRLYPDWTLPIESCDSANQALFFLATSLATDESDLLQRYALAYLFYQTNGPQWRSRENWLTNTDVCLWYGIACANGLVSIVGLENNRIAGVVSRFWISSIYLMSFRNIVVLISLLLFLERYLGS